MKLSAFFRSIVLASAFCWAVDSHAQNRIVDGGFEDNPSGTNNFSSAWTLTPPGGSGPGQQFSNVGTSTLFAHSGENYANLAPADGQTGSLSQTIGTVSGATYTLSFWLANDSSVPVNFFRAVVDGTILYSTSSPPFPENGAYQQITVTFVAAGSSATLEFQYRHDDDFWRLDDVSITGPAPTPTPTPTATATPSPTASPSPSVSPSPTAAPHKLLNISTRLRVRTRDNVLIGGFILTGPEAKRVIVRAIGPSLRDDGVQDPLLDPTLELYDADGQIGFNDNWKDTQQQDIEETQIAPEDERESAIVATLPANSSLYTAIVRGKDETTGVGLVEVYDLARGSNSRLANISSRGFVTTGENVMIGGFIVGGGTTNARVVVRAIGPSLTDDGVAEALPDPTLELVDANGNTIRSNDNWKEGQRAEIEATGLQPDDDRESALVENLPAADYTAIVRGKNDATGVALVEIYQVQ